ncbi:hypothetical protein MTR67_005568 [Solanum verrucosum]|uniref:Reverse transcriptase domain-containing protein n=1 Tax=Solanum verrucosum TaxID=315347 RepID=A0AAF0PWM6_SOLVR|nr:hypothetical protein MTR67_005568 [Solanum verrucosum]
MHKKGPQINHLSYADDLVLFNSGDKYSIKLIMKLLNKYQLASGQEVNRDKSFFLTHHKTDNLLNRRIKRWTGFTQSSFPFNYLGCPIYTGAKKICYFSDISKKILNKIAGWQGRLLSSGGKAVIIKHILQSQTLHIFASLMPPSTVIKEIEMQFANFFWGQRDGKNSYHWASWKNMCFPTKEGGLGFKSLIDICHTFSAKSEAQAALIGISWCLGQQFEALDVELDSQVVVRMINESCKPSWRIHNLIEDIKNKIAQRNIIVKHCYREGNEVADALAQYATTIQEPIIYFQESKLPAEVRGLLRMNKLHLPSFRRRPKKASFWHYDPP